MKKKFIAVYALIGVLALGSTTLTSCVDDNESASVTAVRDAKAAQLNALAALKNAQAEAEKITAEAEAAYKAAETRWQEIQNELEDLELQKEKATLETDLQTAQLNAEAALMAAQKLMEEAKAQLIQALDRVDEANKARINVLIGNANAILNGGSIQIFNASTNAYTTSTTINSTYSTSGTNSIVALRRQLLQEERNLITYNYDLKDLDVAIADYLNDQEATKAEQEALKAGYEELKANSSREAIEKEYTDAKAAQTAAAEAELATNETNLLKTQAVRDYQTDIINHNEINNAISNTDYQTTYTAYVTASGDVATLISGTIGVSDFLSLKDPKEPYKTVITHEDGSVENYTGNYISGEQEFSEEDSKLLSDLLTFISRDIDVYTKEVVNVNQENLNNAITTNQASLTALNNVVTTAKATYDADKSTANFDALQTAEQAVANFETTSGIAGLRTTLENSQTTLEAKQEAQTVITNIQTLLTGDAMTKYAEQYTEIYKLNDEQFAAYIEWRKASHNRTVADALVNTLDDYVDATAPATDLIPDWDDLIARCDQAIRDAEEKIELVNGEDMTDLNGTPIGNKNAKQVLIDEKEANIERIKIQIEQQEAQYDSYMQQAQELIENGSTIPDVEVPETPSEGEGTDTPAEETPAE